MIPRIVHQTWKNNDTSNWIFQKSITSIKRCFPNWDYKFWADEDLDNFIRTYYPSYYLNWANLDRMIKKVDVARYFMLHYYGGVYADLDFVFTKDVTPLIEDGSDLYFYQSTQAIVKKWDFLGNAFMASAREHPFWLMLVEYMFNLPPATKVLHHTGPLAIGAFFKSLDQKPATTIFDPDLFDNHSCQDGVGIRAYGYHMRMASWHGPGRPDGLVAQNR